MMIANSPSQPSEASFVMRTAMLGQITIGGAMSSADTPNEAHLALWKYNLDLYRTKLRGIIA